MKNLKEFDMVSVCCGTKMTLTVEVNDKGQLFLDHSELCSSCLNTAEFVKTPEDTEMVMNEENKILREFFKRLRETLNQITWKMCTELEYGQEIELNSDYTLYHYIEDDIIVVVQTECWTEKYQVLIDSEEILYFESLT